CVKSSSPIAVSEPSLLVAGGGSGTISCNGGSTTLAATASGGTSPYQYSIDGGANYQVSASFTVLAGNYTVTVKDNAGCVKSSSPIAVSEPSLLVAGGSAGTISCNGGSTTLTATASGGTSPFQYSIDGGANYQVSASFTVLAGNYTVTVRDDAVCVKSSSPIAVSEPSLLVAGGSAGTISCNGGSTTLTATASGG